ncbi:helix-turn-helix domain-containing protein [Streptomyces sp. H27-D2]|uniref:helix-turn-helix domain-containing protein n=1 Tax=Streptomyces sp. H27-D2 TaxID=3046304 RepID=UPI002DBE30CE|nr:helix-turn-helix transcriptional regulator [Streptomyces sp. H27-D2]MEC4015194.1 helix-turn-helix transcriptional regulator [Streptomyces sp. H27-D2]
MPPSTPPPPVRRRRLGTELRRLRERTDLSATEAAKRLGVTQSRVSNIEAGRYGVSADRVRTLASHYECADQALVDALAAMTGDRKRGWWEEYREMLPAGLLELAELEHHATALRVAQVINIPGLLQTPAHARALFGESVPPLPAHEIEHRVSHRIKRQAVLHQDNPPQYTAIIHEAALRMQFGGPATTRSQLEHLIAVSEREHITIAVIPFGSTSFPTSAQGVDYICGSVPQLDTVGIDTSTGSELTDDASRLAKYRLVLDRMESVTLPPDLSRDLVHRIIREL